MPGGYLRYLISFYEEKEARKRQRRCIREFAEAYELPENEFLENFKFSKNLIDYLIEELEGDLAPATGDGIPVKTKVLTCLKLLLDGHYQRGIGNEQSLSVGQTTVSKHLQQFITAVNTRLKPRWIQFPGTETARQNVAQKFLAKYGLPDILGAIDCTHVQIFPPPFHENPIQYLNQSRKVTINVQLVADANARILNCNANYPGRTHDQFIFNNSLVRRELKRLYDARIGSYYVLGDSGYSLEPWLMTPIRDAPPESPEERYTNWHCQTRNVIERTNGYLKGTFRSLGRDRCLHYGPAKASQMIYTCCTIYNIMKHFRVPMDFVDIPREENNPHNYELNQGGRLLDIRRRKQNNIIRTYFA